MTVKNKWNDGLYEVIDDSKKEIVLKRLSDNATLTIAKSEYTFSYKPSLKTVEK